LEPGKALIISDTVDTVSMAGKKTGGERQPEFKGNSGVADIDFGCEFKYNLI
jgi:hypothetical protein